MRASGESACRREGDAWHTANRTANDHFWSGDTVRDSSLDGSSTTTLPRPSQIRTPSQGARKRPKQIPHELHLPYWALMKSELQYKNEQPELWQGAPLIPGWPSCVCPPSAAVCTSGESECKRELSNATDKPGPAGRACGSVGSVRGATAKRGGSRIVAVAFGQVVGVRWPAEQHRTRYDQATAQGQRQSWVIGDHKRSRIRRIQLGERDRPNVPSGAPSERCVSINRTLRPFPLRQHISQEKSEPLREVVHEQTKDSVERKAHYEQRYTSTE